jgi:TP901 family phage tail tape measure protein
VARQVILRFLGDTTSLDSAFRKLRAESTAASATMSAQWTSAGKKITSAGKTITHNLSAPAAIAGGYAAKLALDFDASMLKIQSLVGESAEQVQAWRGDVLEMSRVLPQSADELAQALYFITSSGIDSSAALEVLNSTARASAAGLGETQMLADLATSAMNAYGPANLSAAETMDILIAAIREGKAEPEEFASSLGRVIAPAQNLGVSFDQVTGAMASMSLVGISADEAATGLRATLMALQKPSAGQKKAAEALGLSFDEIRKSVREKGLLSTLTDLRDRIGDDQEALGAIFPNVRAFNAVLSTTGENLGNTNRIMASTADATGGVNEAFGITATGAKFKLNAALSSLQATMIEIGAVIVPVLVSSMERLATIFDWLGNQPPWVMELVGHLLIFVAALGPVIIFIGKLVTAIGTIMGAVGPVLGALAKFWGVLVKIFGVLKTVFFWLRVISMFLAATFGAPIIAAVAVIGLLVAAFVIAWKHSETFRNIVRAAMNAVGAVLKAAGGWFVALGKKIWEVLQQAWNVVKSVAASVIAAFVSIWASVQPILQTLWNAFKTVFDAIATVVKVALKVIMYAILIPLAAIGVAVVTALNVMLEIWATVFEAVATLTVKVWAAIYKVVSTVIEKVRAVVEKVLNVLRKAWDAAWNKISEIASAAWDKITELVTRATDAVRSVVTKVMGTIRSLWDRAWSAIRSAASAAWDAIRNVVSSGVNAVRSVVSSVMNSVRSVFSKIWNALPSPVRSALGSIKSLVTSGINAVFSTVRSLGSRITGIAGSLFSGLKNGFRSAVNWIIGRWNGLSLRVPSVSVMGKEVFGGATISTPNIPLLANGAVVDKPTLAMIGEAGREVVLPLTRPARAMELLEESGLLSRLSGSSGAGNSTEAPPPARVIHVQRGAVQVEISGVAQDVAADAREAVTDAFTELLEELRDA